MKLNFNFEVSIDLDDFVVETMPALCRWHNEAYGTAINTKGIATLDYAALFGVPNDEAIKRVREFFQSKHHLQSLPVPGSLEGIKELQKILDRGNRVSQSRLHILTARSTEYEGPTRELVRELMIPRNIPIHFTDYSSSLTYKPKGAIARKLKVNCHGDDSIDNVMSCNEYNIEGVLLLQPWNADIPYDLRVKNFKKFVDHVAKKHDDYFSGMLKSN